MRGTEKLEIQLVDEGEDWFRGTIRTYFTHGGGRVRKYKFVARIRPRPNGDDTFDSESFHELITLASNASWGIPTLEQTQVAVNAWNRLRVRILSRGWRQVRTTDADLPWYSRYSYLPPLRNGRK